MCEIFGFVSKPAKDMINMIMTKSFSLYTHTQTHSVFSSPNETSIICCNICPFGRNLAGLQNRLFTL